MFTLTGNVVAEHPVVLLVKEKVAEPIPTPVTKPALFTVATAGLLLTHVPPEEGLSVVVLPICMSELPVMETSGSALTVKVLELLQPVVLLVNISVAVPDETEVTTPELVTVATEVLLLAQVPPLLGDTNAVPPIQTSLAPPRTGRGLIVTVPVVFEHPVVLLVNVKVTFPAEIPVTIPALLTVATAGLLLAQTPPDVGLNVVVDPAQIDELPVMLTDGIAYTVKLLVLEQPVVLFV